MAGQLQLRRGTTAENDAFTGAEGELSYDTQAKQIRVHDGSTMGGKICGGNGYVRVITEVTFLNETTRWGWYRLWSNGWVEICAGVDRGTYNGITFPFALNPFTVQITGESGNPRYATIQSVTTTGMTFNSSDDSSWNNDGWFRIYIAGYKA